MARHPVLDGILRALTLAPGIVPVGMLFGAHRMRASRGTPLRAASAEAPLRSGPVIVNELAFCGRRYRCDPVAPRT